MFWGAVATVAVFGVGLVISFNVWLCTRIINTQNEQISLAAKVKEHKATCQMYRDGLDQERKENRDLLTKIVEEIGKLNGFLQKVVK